MANLSGCMLILAVISQLHSGSAESNGVAEKHFYEELGCTAVTTEKLAYDCGNLKSRDQSKCYFRNQEIVRDDNATGESVPGSCLASCRCVTPPPSTEPTVTSGPSLECASIECPDLFHRNAVPPGCEKSYSRDSCCNDGIICAPNAPDSSPQIYQRINVTDSTFRCNYGGKTFLEGTKFYPDDAPCTVCYCRQGFNGKLEAPYCRDVVCGFELHYADRLRDGCSPVFLKQDACCPIDWRCPDPADQVVASTKQAGTAAEGTCKWGSLTLGRGDSLQASSCMECSCSVPPFVTCRNQPDCST